MGDLDGVCPSQAAAWRSLIRPGVQARKPRVAVYRLPACSKRSQKMLSRLPPHRVTGSLDHIDAAP